MTQLSDYLYETWWQKIVQKLALSSKSQTLLVRYMEMCWNGLSLLSCSRYRHSNVMLTLKSRAVRYGYLYIENKHLNSVYWEYVFCSKVGYCPDIAVSLSLFCFFIIRHGAGESGHYNLFLPLRYHTSCFRGTTTCLAGTVKCCLKHALKDCTSSDGKEISGITCLWGNVRPAQFAMCASQPDFK